MPRTLSRNESKVVLALEWQGRRPVTLAEIRQALGASAGYARFVAHRLVQKGWLERLRPGVYQFVPASRGPEGVADSNPLSVGAALGSPYFYSFGTACTHHSLTTQVFADIYVACLGRRRPLALRGMRYVFVAMAESRFFGFEPVDVFGQSVQIATRERALLDAIDRPQYAGGIGEVAQIAARAVALVAWRPLVEMAARWSDSALVQRLGYLCELQSGPLAPTVRGRLMGLIRPGSKIMLGPRRRWGTSGKLALPWNVVENVPRRVLVPEDTARRRRITFPRTDSKR